MPSRPLLRRAADGADAALRLVAPAFGAWTEHRARACGLDRTTVLVSFDCDTEQDIEVVPEVHERLGALGITPSYAVPGELLRRGAHVYEPLAATGVEFINHGDRSHCHYDPVTRTYVSSFFYDQLPPEVVEGDIRGGDRAVHEVTGTRPTGFRTPHFGSFQRPRHRRLLQRVLRTLGYRYSSSTTPLRGLLLGPAHRFGPLVELPVSGTPDRPRRVLDSWSFRFAPDRAWREDDYVTQVRKLLSAHQGGERPGLINLYADPSQVAGWDPFFEAMAELAPLSAPSFRSVVGALR
jgi:peptidoglycan/xylan/chitin deacetylase (PgdA/CDA1 family)